MTASRVPPEHARHDLVLVAAHVAGDTSPEETSRAAALLAVCPDCRQVAADLVAITMASRALPAPARRRDFRLTPEQAERIRRPSLARRLARALLAARGPARALPAGLMTLGLAALLVSTIPGLPGAALPASREGANQAFSGPSAAPTANDVRTGGGPAPAGQELVSGSPGPGAPNLAPGVTSDAAASPAADRGLTPGPNAAAGGAQGSTAGAPTPPPAGPTEIGTDRAVQQPPSLLLIASIVLFGAGILLLVARRVASRQGP